MIKKLAREKFNKIFQRFDEAEYLDYFKVEDFEGLKAFPYYCMSFGTRLNGFLYHYDKYMDDTIIIFCHGIGGGHSSYMREIDALARRGFIVLGFDYTGCNISEGESSIGLSSSVRDLYSVIKSLKEDEHFKDKKIYTIGHSWGAFASLAVNNFIHVDKVVGLAPFASLKIVYRAFFPLLLRPLLIPIAYSIEKERTGEFAEANVVDAINRSDVKSMIVVSENDPMIPYKSNSLYIKNKVDKGNLTFKVISGRHHQPQYTSEASNYFFEKESLFNKGIKEKKIVTLEDRINYFKDVDFKKATDQDESLWDEIKEFFLN